jgi:hypothetical protein
MEVSLLPTSLYRCLLAVHLFIWWSPSCPPFHMEVSLLPTSLYRRLPPAHLFIYVDVSLLPTSLYGGFSPAHLFGVESVAPERHLKLKVTI